MSNSHQSHDQKTPLHDVQELGVRDMHAMEGGIRYEPIVIRKRIDKTSPLIAGGLSDDMADEFLAT